MDYFVLKNNSNIVTGSKLTISFSIDLLIGPWFITSVTEPSYSLCENSTLARVTFTQIGNKFLSLYYSLVCQTWLPHEVNWLV